MNRQLGHLIRATCLAAALAAPGCGGASDAEPPEPIRTPPLGVVTEYDANWNARTFLTRLDPASLSPRGPRVRVPEYHSTWSFSPDGREVAVGTGGQGLGIHVYDVARMARARAVRTGIAAEAVAWLAPRRLVAGLQSGEIAVVDPRAGRVVRHRALRPGEGVCFGGHGSATTERGMVLLLGASAGQRPRLVLVDADGTLRAVSLPRAGMWSCDGSDVAVDPQRGRAFVVSPGTLVAEVDLAAMRATYHRVTGPRRARTRHREAFWLGDGKLLAVGRDRRDGPTGVSIIDTATWTERVVDVEARAAHAVEGRVLAYDGVLVDRRGDGMGVAGYGRDGERLFHVLEGEQIDFVHALGARAFAQGARTVYAVDPATGEVTNESPVRRTEFDVLDRPQQAGG